ncbi:hypothetical protein TNCV_4057301 [Trichonephila clavipes]|nr:hypothetical protein TNCV_4057301 [Trichonephila clavipes]
MHGAKQRLLLTWLRSYEKLKSNSKYVSDIASVLKRLKSSIYRFLSRREKYEFKKILALGPVLHEASLCRSTRFPSPLLKREDNSFRTPTQCRQKREDRTHWCSD